MQESKKPKYHNPHPPGQHRSPHAHQPDKAAESTNLTNPYEYQTNGKKKHRDMTPI